MEDYGQILPYEATGSGELGAPDVGAIITSLDGITWNTPTTPVGGFGLSLDLVRWSPALRLFCVSGIILSEGETTGLAFLTSKDGVTWDYYPKYTTELTDLCWSPRLHKFCTMP